MKVPGFVLLLFCAACAAYATSTYALDNNDDGKPDQWFTMDGDRVLTMQRDRDFDGVIDYNARYNGNKEIETEEFDFNYDGRMDDFYYYDHDGLLERQEIDSNFDDKIDIWVYLYQGMYIKKYERDVDYDGKIDLIKEYGSE